VAKFPSFKIAKSGFSLLRKNKALAIPYIIASILSAAIVAGTLVALFTYFSAETLTLTDSGEEIYEFSDNPIATFVLFTVAGAILALIHHIADSTVVSYALDIFRGKKTSMRKAYKHVRNRLKPIALFSILSIGIATIISEVADRIPFIGGKIVTNLAGVAWSIASVFAIPVLVGSEKEVGPIEAVKKSGSMIKESFGENVKVGLGLALIAVPIFLGWLVNFMAFFAVMANTSVNAEPSTTELLVIGGYAIVTFSVLVAIMSVLTGVTRAALYHYVETGKAPAQFEKDMFKSMITEKKARKIFGKSVGSPF